MERILRVFSRRYPTQKFFAHFAYTGWELPARFVHCDKKRREDIVIDDQKCFKTFFSRACYSKIWFECFHQSINQSIDESPQIKFPVACMEVCCHDPCLLTCQVSGGQAGHSASTTTLVDGRRLVSTAFRAICSKLMRQVLQILSIVQGGALAKWNEGRVGCAVFGPCVGSACAGPETCSSAKLPLDLCS